MNQIGYQPDYSGSHALLIGVDVYRQAPPLATAVKGVRALADVLQSELGFPPENLTILEDENATQRNIRRKLVEPLSRPDVVGPNDRVIIYFAGHGVTVSTASGPQGYIVPIDGEPQYYDTLIAMDELTRTAAEHIHAKHVIFLLDACFSGFATVRMSETSERQYRDYLMHPVRQVIAAGTRDQAVSDVWGPGGHSLFTGFLIDGLRGAAPTPGGMLRGFHLAGWLQDQVAQHSRSLQTPQYATLLGSGGGDFIFSVRDEIVEPEQLPDEVLSLLESPLPEARRAGAQTLAHLLASSQPVLAGLARERLERLANSDDSLSVRQAAQLALGSSSTAVGAASEPAPSPAAPAPVRVSAAATSPTDAGIAKVAETPTPDVEVYPAISSEGLDIPPVSAAGLAAASRGWFKARSRAVLASQAMVLLATGWFFLAWLGWDVVGLPMWPMSAALGLANGVVLGLLLNHRHWSFIWPVLVTTATYALIINGNNPGIGLLIAIALTIILIWVLDATAHRAVPDGSNADPALIDGRVATWAGAWLKGNIRALWASVAVIVASYALMPAASALSETFYLPDGMYSFSVVILMAVFGGLSGLAISLAFGLILKRRRRALIWPMVVWTLVYAVTLAATAEALRYNTYSPDWIVWYAVLAIPTVIYVWVAHSRARRKLRLAAPVQA